MVAALVQGCSIIFPNIDPQILEGSTIVVLPRLVGALPPQEYSRDVLPRSKICSLVFSLRSAHLIDKLAMIYIFRILESLRRFSSTHLPYNSPCLTYPHTFIVAAPSFPPISALLLFVLPRHEKSCRRCLLTQPPHLLPAVRSFNTVHSRTRDVLPLLPQETISQTLYRHHQGVLVKIVVPADYIANLR